MPKGAARGAGAGRPPELEVSIVPPSRRISALRILGRFLVLEESWGEAMLAKPIRVKETPTHA